MCFYQRIFYLPLQLALGCFWLYRKWPANRSECTLNSPARMSRVRVKWIKKKILNTLYKERSIKPGRKFYIKHCISRREFASLPAAAPLPPGGPPTTSTTTTTPTSIPGSHYLPSCIHFIRHLRSESTSLWTDIRIYPNIVFLFVTFENYIL